MSPTRAAVPPSYASGVATRKKHPRSAPLTPEQVESLARLRPAATAYNDAQRALDRALIARTEAIRAEFSILNVIGWARAARELNDLIGEGTLRGNTRDMRASERAEAED